MKTIISIAVAALFLLATPAFASQNLICLNGHTVDVRPDVSAILVANGFATAGECVMPVIVPTPHHHGHYKPQTFVCGELGCQLVK